MQALLGRGFDMLQRDSYGRSPYDYARDGGFAEVLAIMDAKLRGVHSEL